MNKQSRLIFCITFICLLFSTTGQVFANPDSEQQIITDAFKTTLVKAIDDALVGYYGKRYKSFEIHEMKVKEVHRMTPSGFGFIVKVQVDTFEGPHEPPYGRETLTLEVGPGGVFVTKLEHKDLP
ncbi:DUF3888 domain-containing protein [Hazenella coriacea]|uniref:Uncharacterized protein DUF3888 n=1 Tax=Hazenella coriacea TaxID=1179467 RepID=A0A4R3L2J3_9BACL|nr:DUF3888 domain-containing protein [Hazenella coriacea]TCS93115.1 uncharacterized protein DUF3888 [Hazenella coriacea]